VIGARERTLLVLLAALGATGAGARAASAQVDQSDLQSRSGVRLNLNLPGKWEVDLDYQFRMVDDLSTYRGSYFTVETDYHLTKEVTAIGTYRYILGNEGNAHRFAAGLELETRLDRLKLAFRPLIQYRTAFVDDGDVGGDGDTFARTRLRAEYPVTKKLDVYGSVEPFFGFGGEYPVDNWRNELGLQYAFSKGVRLDLYYIYRPDYGKAYNRLFHTVGITLRFRTKVGN
jgi:predicted porin